MAVPRETWGGQPEGSGSNLSERKRKGVASLTMNLSSVGEKGLYSGHIWKLEPAGFAAKLNGTCIKTKRKREKFWLEH
jgi:hypothetical protein